MNEVDRVDMIAPDGNPEVVKKDEIEDWKKKGYVLRDETYLAQKQEEADARYAEWIVNPETEQDRFDMLNQGCAQRLSATDRYMTPDYPISDESKEALFAYRKALRELNHQEGAPWDGGGSLTPWPEMPEITKK